ncbi:hypothetical protein HYDPIDRAFT_115361 [Hydnomerulius pinastri MD-312]|uniref:GDP/GTP exchange factor Sec2 N-terminal domain-containing protein n=1 Tax=Hydnomerulius pinastri MD-312 TaxID=994086 RepID=A0A0C9V865_9AGAM|nr:hypothetical protein HYDPIDRAFT_115361 [Hydnomerulius pinastri MD-312]
MDEPHEITNEVVVNNGDVAHDDERDEDASDAQAQVIASLRSQVTDLFSQVTQLNSKLVSSYDRVSDLEDQLHDSSASLRNATVTISSLELERTHHLAALNTGLLVEKAHVTAELNRLMERATEEAAQRGQAESARQDIEKDLDDLSATLFQQANTMVAEARLNQARSERKVLEAEEALKGAEDAVKLMQTQMQALEADKESAERGAQEARISMGKGKWVERDDLRVGEVPKMRFMITHAPYAEFIAFVTHLRGLRSSQPTLPVISSLLGQPFLARLLTEDSEPTVRLDLAPSLNWLSRRSVLAAIHTGMLIVEPMSFSHLLQELHLHSQSQSSTSVSCALCGTPIVRLLPPIAPEKPPSHPLAALARSNGTNGNSWFKYPLALSSTTQVHDSSVPRSAEYEPPEQVYIFRLAAATSSQPPPALAPVHTSSASTSGVGPVLSRPPTHHTTQSRVLPAQTQNSPHPLCISNYCLLRLRSTCSLWAFVRTGIIERVWEEEVVQAPKSSARVDNLSANGQAPGLARTTSPIPGRMSTSSPFPPSRTGSPAPAHGAPPVPRRAAARRAVPPPPGTAGPAASETAKDVEPAPVAAAAPPAEETVKAQEDSPSKDQSAPVPDTSMDAVVSTNENIMSTSTGGGVDDTQVSASSDAQPAVITPEAAAPAPADPEPIAPAQSHISVDVPSTEKSRSSTDSSIEKSIDTASTKRSSNIDGEGFASDATWEERTWKEVVRLKEEMFWARIGGVQAL